MKTCLKGSVPPLLEQYQLDNPSADWEQFKNECHQGYKDVRDQLHLDQGNLCCYCEIDTKQGFGVGNDDFRVEHFHPKSNKLENSIVDVDNTNRNWALDWQNMLGCCHGGSINTVIDNETRFVPKHAERHSDVLKGNLIWDDEILNPLKIPAFPILFQANRRDGSLSVHENNCRDAGVSLTKASNCLNPEKLNLNSAKLNSLRKAALDALNRQIEHALSSGMAIDQAISNLAKAELRKDEKGHWPRFFTTVRSYLGKAAEDHLNNIGYTG